MVRGINYASSSKHFKIKPKQYFILFLSIKYSWKLSTSSFSIELWSTEKLYTVRH